MVVRSMHSSLALLLLHASPFSAEASRRQTYLLDSGWRFRLATTNNRTTTPIAPPTDDTAGISSSRRRRRRCSDPACHPATDDSSWRTVNVPHDFVVEGTPDATSNDKAHGYLPNKLRAWYRKTFVVPPPVGDDDGGHGDGHGGNRTRRAIRLDFDGVMVSATVYLNGVLLGSHHGDGYSPFGFDLTEESTTADLMSSPPLLGVGDGSVNVLAVLVDSDPAPQKSWWYDGGGIYRHVRLTVTDLVRVPPYGIYAPTAVVGPINAGGTVADGTVAPVTTVMNSRPDETMHVSVVVRSVVRLKGSGEQVGEAAVSSPTRITGGGGTRCIHQTIPVPSARLWSPDRPNLYVLTTTVLLVGGTTVDEVETTLGIRHTRWDADTGFHLNGIPTKIRGNANHQDMAGVGVAVPDSLQKHRIRKLKWYGSNGWRTAHNPPTPALLDAADEVGFLVWDENHMNGRSDEMATLIRRDRNHPSVIIWSICNEALCNERGNYSDAREAGMALKAIIEDLDPSMGRPVSANNNDWNGPDTFLDVQGIDYAPQTYDAVHASNPSVPCISSETSSAVSDRGEYVTDGASGHQTSYPNAVPWGNTAQEAWEAIMTRPFMAGGWTWTGWDYRGEPTPLEWPDVGSHFGNLDYAGFPKDRAHWYRVNWGEGGGVYVFPHWNWDDGGGRDRSLLGGRTSDNRRQHLAKCQGMCRIGEDGRAYVDVIAYTDRSYVELWVDGESMGAVSVPRYGRAEWNGVLYVPGTMEAVAYNDGENEEGSLPPMTPRTPLATTSMTVETTEEPIALRASIMDGVGAEGISNHGCGSDDVAIVKAEVIDRTGRVVPVHGMVNVSFTVVGGDGTIIGTGNGDPSCQVPDASLARPVFHGYAMALVRATGYDKSFLRSGTGKVGASIEVKVVSPGLTADSVKIPVQNVVQDDEGSVVIAHL